MQENDKIIKLIQEHNCPKCGEKLFVETRTTPAMSESVFTFEQMNDAKKDIIQRIDIISIDDDKKINVLKWINDPATFFGPGDVEDIIQSLLRPE